VKEVTAKMFTRTEQEQKKVAAKAVENKDLREQPKERKEGGSMHSGNETNDEAEPLVQTTQRKNMTERPKTLDIPTISSANQEQGGEEDVDSLTKQWAEGLFVNEESPLYEETLGKTVPNNPDTSTGLPVIHLREVEQREKSDSGRSTERWGDSGLYNKVREAKQHYRLKEAYLNKRESERAPQHERSTGQLTEEAKEVARKLGRKTKRGSWIPLHEVISGTREGIVKESLN